MLLSLQGKAAAQALEALESAIGSTRRHGPTHPLAEKALTAAAEALAAYTQEHGPLTAAIRRHAIVVGDEPVLGSEERPSELMRLLLSDGIARITLDPGFPRAELQALVDVLAAQWRGDDQVPAGDGRLLSALWGAGLMHLTYRVYDPLAPNATHTFQRRGSLGHDASSELLAPVAERAGDLVEALMLAEEGLPSSQRFFRRLLRSSPPSSDPSDWSTLPERAPSFLDAPEGRARRKLLDRVPETDAAERERVLDLVAWSAAQGAVAPSATECARFLAGVAAACLADGDLRGAAAAVARSGELEDPPTIRRILTERLGTRRALELVARGLRAYVDKLEGDELILLGMRFLRYLDDQAVAPACELYPQLSHPDVRRVFRRLLTYHADAHADLIEPLTRVQDEAIVSEAIGILALGEPGSRARELLDQAAADTLEPRRTLALDALDVVTGERKRRQLSQLVSDGDDRTARLNAIKQLKADGSPRAFEELAELVSRPEFAQRDEQEQHLAFDALTEIGGLRSVRVLTEITERRTGFFKRKQIEQLKQNAYNWLMQLKRKKR